MVDFAEYLALVAVMEEPYELPNLTAVAHARPPWMRDAACAEHDRRLFFPAMGGTTADAKRICQQCPVRQECLDYALALGPATEGVWGGTSQRERRGNRRTAA